MSRSATTRSKLPASSIVGRVNSKQVYKQMKAKELRQLYYPYHSLDPAQAIERILESNGSEEEDYTEKGVRILREILEREKKAEKRE